MCKQGMKHVIWGWLGVAIVLLSGCRGGCDAPPGTDLFAVSFRSAGVGVTASTRSDVSPLSDGTTLRILAFRRVGGSSDLSVDRYMGEGVYEVPAGSSGGLLIAVSPLLLASGTYDFYALTPSLRVTRGNNAGGNTYTVPVEHETDYATSLTESVAVSEAAPSVSLTALIRRCTKLTFALSPQGDNIRAVHISSAGVTNMTDAPVRVPLNEALNVSGLSRTREVSVNDFTAPDSSRPLLQESSTVVLPREAGSFSFKMTVAYDNSGRTTELSAPLPDDLVFSAGIHYTFTVKMLGGHADLVLSVSPWVESTDFSTDMGGPNVIEILIGSWTDVHWEANASWSDEFGG